jgi:hypothetical protein
MDQRMVTRFWRHTRGGAGVASRICGLGWCGPDGTLHGSFDVFCGGNTLTVVDKPGSSNVITVNGQPSNSVWILFGLTIRENGEIVFDFQKATDNPKVVVCDVEPEPGFEFTGRVINTPPQ